MAAIMIDARGVGLAAPQVGSLRRLVVVRTGDEGEEIVALCNPRITWRSEEEEIDSEGCLSIGEISVDVARAVAIRVEAQDVEGRPIELEPEGFAARVIQHELDHLDGVLILDRTAPEQRREALRALRDEGSVPMRVAFAGSPEAAVPPLRALVARGHDVTAVVTQPDRARGRSGRPSPTPVAAAAAASSGSRFCGRRRSTTPR